MLGTWIAIVFHLQMARSNQMESGTSDKHFLLTHNPFITYILLNNLKDIIFRRTKVETFSMIVTFGYYVLTEGNISHIRLMCVQFRERLLQHKRIHLPYEMYF